MKKDGAMGVIANTSKDVYRLQTAMLEMPQTECPLEHEFVDGLYIRKMFIPAGTLVVGKCHRFATYNILSLGDATIYSGEGMPITRIKAPYTFISDPGVKKVGLFHTDSIWMNIFATHETDLEKIEAHFIIPESELVELNREDKLCLSQPQQ